MLGKNYLEVMTPQYQGQFLIAASRDYAQANPGAVKAFLAGLLKADEKLAADQARLRPRRPPPPAVRCRSRPSPPNGRTTARIGLNKELLPTLMQQAAWINSTGLIKTPASEELLRSPIAKEPLASLAPDRVAL